MKSKLMRSILILCICCIQITAYANTSNEVIGIINNFYYDDTYVDKIKNIKNDTKEEYIRKIVKILDEYSDYYPKDEYDFYEEKEKNVESNIDDKTAVVCIKSFVDGVDLEVNKIIEELNESNNPTLYIDLRGCGGGQLDVMTNIALNLVPSGPIYTLKSKYNSQTFYSDLKTSKIDVVILTSKKTASAAEIFAAALQESGGGVIIGERTFGKSSVQTFYTLNDGGILKITTGECFTRNNNNIKGVGVIPDFEIKWS